MRFLALTALLLLSQSQLLLADVIVDFGGSYVTQNQDMLGVPFQGSGVDIDGSNGANDAIGGFRFSTTTTFSPAISPNYSGTSARFYGGAVVGELATNGPVTFNKAEIKKGTTDSPHLHGGSGQQDMQAIFLWKKEDFLNGGQSIFFDSNSSVFLNLGQDPTSALQASQIRLLVQDNTANYWLSETIFDQPHANESYTWTFGATSDGKWASFDPTRAFSPLTLSGTDLRFDAGTASFETKNFSSIQAIGFYYDQNAFVSSADFHFEEFVVNAASVPEPASMIQLSLVAMLAAARFRRRAKLKAKERLTATQNPLA